MFARAIHSSDTIDDACDALLEADRLIARAISIIGSCDVESSTGLSAEMLLSLRARRTFSEARLMVHAATTLRAMPLTRAAFLRGDLSWAQVRAITAAVRYVDVTGRAGIDELIARTDYRGDPDELLARVDDGVARARADLQLAREDRSIDRGFLAVQGRLDGSASFYGEADAQSTATILEALDAHADDPVAVDEAPSRAAQRLDALVGICEASLNGGHTQTTRPRPRLLATIDLDELQRTGKTQGTRLLWNLAGRPARLTPLATETLLCDAVVTHVVFDGARPAAVSDAQTAVSSKLRTALTARDGGCRFPGCRAPVAWCDAHHIRARIHDGPTVIDNLLLLCRRCHRRVHRFRWGIALQPDGTISFTRRGQTYSSYPRASRRE